MTIKTRLIILAACVALFLVVVPYIILFSLGYRIDTRHFSVVATGGIYVKVEPGQATVTIDSTATDTGIFNNPVFLQNLLPGPHAITITKPDYFDYKKTLDVNQNQVTKLEHVTLFKTSPVFSVLPTTIDKGSTLVKTDNPLISPDTQKILLCNDHEISYATAQNPQAKQFLNRFSETLANCQWLNNDYVIFTLNDKITISELDTRQNINIISLPQPATKIQFNQQDKKLYVLTEKTTLVSERLLP